MIFFSILIKDGSSESNKNNGQEMLLAGEMMSSAETGAALEWDLILGTYHSVIVSQKTP